VAGQSDCDFRSTLAGCWGNRALAATDVQASGVCWEDVLAGCRYRSADGAAGPAGVLERMLATALRCCGSRELQISDSGV